ncbi:hypothetical protein PFLG_02731 [Plasmodium falciparum RAJ116]|uniref:Clathrin/coatomer adaptor adaptin-like N-terminal domain-containing protein n=1 Tax=Plasmodium falciparum RAJ116 TaxID=580058 RepID=A0A0L0CZT1_PLAFA|nr:hypothetical protein PFLG_02731 [Plasmodium falciparum RAJ116]
MIKHSIKGLYCFIDEVRNCRCKEDEEKKVLQEIIKIKKKFNEKNITNYKRKKYIWKLIYCHILGYGISLSYLDIIKLISSNNFSDKYCGYTALSLLVDENNEMLNIMVSTIKADIKNNDEKINFLAFHFATNIYKKRHDLLLRGKNDFEIFKFLDQNLNEINMFNIFAYLNLLYVIILIFQKYESMYYYIKKEEKKKNSLEEKNDDILKREELKFDNSSSSSGSSNHSRRISLHIKNELKKKRSKSNIYLNEQNFLYNDLKKVDKILEIESECTFNIEEIDFYEIKKYINKYIHFILNVLYLILDENLKIDEGFYYSHVRYPFLLIKCLQMIQLYDVHNLSQTTINNINDIMYKIISKPYRKLQGRLGNENNPLNNNIPNNNRHTIANHFNSTNNNNNNNNNNNDYNNNNKSSNNNNSSNIFKKSFSKNSIYSHSKKNKDILRNEKSAIYIEYGIIYECSNLYNFLDDKIEIE